MRNIIICMLIVLFATTVMAGCVYQKSYQEPPELSISIGDKQVQYITAKNQWNGSKYDREDTFKTIMKEGSGIEVPSIEMGNTVEISFKSNQPDKFTVSDILIDEKGEQIYTDKEIKTIPVELKDNKCSFKIEEHFASALSSTYEENKVDIRGYRMTATWGENECEYAFVIKTYKSQKSVGTIIDSKLNAICSVPSFSSNPYDYIKNSKDFEDIVSMGDDALKYLLAEFKVSKDNGLKEYVMAIACSKILKEDPENKKWGSGREWYDNYIEARK